MTLGWSALHPSHPSFINLEGPPTAFHSSLIALHHPVPPPQPYLRGRTTTPRSDTTAAYTTDDAMRELSQRLGKPPAGAVRGECEATTMQAEHSSRTGDFHDADRNHVEEGRPDSLTRIGEIVEKLEARAAMKLAVPVSTRC